MRFRLRTKGLDLGLRQKLRQAVEAFASEFVHVDDFRGFPQILYLRIRQFLDPIFFRLFAELRGLSRHIVVL